MNSFGGSAVEVAEREQKDGSHGIDETVAHNYFFFAENIQRDREVHFIFQGIEGQLSTKRHTTWRDVYLTLGTLGQWVGLWESRGLDVPSTELLLQVFDVYEYVNQTLGVMFNIKSVAQ